MIPLIMSYKLDYEISPTQLLTNTILYVLPVYCYDFHTEVKIMDDYRKEANIQVGKRLREARNSLGRTQAEIAVSLGVSEEHYRKYES